MATPDSQRARKYHAEQAALAATGAAQIGRMIATRVPWAVLLSRFAELQLQAATKAIETMADWLGRPSAQVDPAQFAGVSSAGFPISEPLIATIDARVPAPPEPLPAPWWSPGDLGKILRPIQQLVASEIQDAARSAAQAEMVADDDPRKYVRVLVPPSCKRCAVLAGSTYRELDGFDRHPGCDCVHYLVTDWAEAERLGLVMSVKDAIEGGHVRDLTQHERRAIADGADPVETINSATGIATADLFGRRLRVTSYGTTVRSAWRKANPTRPVRLRPESIYRIVDQEYDGDPAEARRLLKVYGYIKA